MLKDFIKILHDNDKNPYKDIVDFTKRRGRTPNIVKENREKYKQWEKENEVKICGFLDSLLTANESELNQNKILIRYKPKNNV